MSSSTSENNTDESPSNELLVPSDDDIQLTHVKNDNKMFIFDLYGEAEAWIESDLSFDRDKIQ